MSARTPQPRDVRVVGRAVALVVATLLVGCGPFGYLTKVARDATRAVAAAERAEAEKYAPYEYWGAVTYLEQAKILMAYSEYERSFDYGGRAKQLAEEAKAKAERREAGKTKETMDDKAKGDAKASAGKASSAGTGSKPKVDVSGGASGSTSGGGDK